MKIETIQHQGLSALVEWKDGTGPHRAVIPQTCIKDGEAALQVLEWGIPYGAPWELLYTVTVTPLQIARLLREKGIWTEHDLQSNIAGTRAAIAQAYSIDLKVLLDTARMSREGAEQ